MSGNITVSSTTDSQEQVERAAEYGNEVPRGTAEEKPEQLVLPEVEETETAAAPETAQQENEEEEVPEEEQPEEDEPEPEAAKPVQQVGRTRRQREATISRLLARIEELERKSKPQPAAQGKPDYSQRPRTDDPKYKDKGIEDVIEDMVRHVNQKDAEARTKAEQTEAQEKQQARIEKIYSEYRLQVEAAEDAHGDFDEVVARNVLPMAAQLAIIDMPNGAEVAYHVNQDSELVDRLKAWDDPDVKSGYNRIVSTLWSISQDLSGEKSEKSAPSSAETNSPPSRSLKPRPALPAPIRPVGGAATNPSQGGYRDNMSFREYKKLRDSGWDGPGRY